MTLDIAKILSLGWLTEEDFKLVLPTGNKYVVHRARVFRRIYEQMDKGVSNNSASKHLAEYTTGSNWLSITKIIKATFNPANLLTGKYLSSYKKNRKELNEERFVIKVIRRDTGKEIGYVDTCIDEVDTAGLVASKKPVIDLSVVVEKRKRIQEKKEVTHELVVLDDSGTESLAVQICTDFATGLITINECCDRYGITYLYWAELCQRSEYIRGMYEKAITISHFFNNSRQLTMVENIIVEMLATRKHKTVKRRYEWIHIPGKLERVRVQKGVEEETERDFTISELAGLQALLLRGAQLNPGVQDEFANMTDEEIMDFIKKSTQPEAQLNPPS